MSTKLLQRVALLGSVAGLSIISAANAVETKFGNVDITFDTTVSVGAQMRTSDRNNEFVADANGGNHSLVAGDLGSVTIPSLSGTGFTGLCGIPAVCGNGNFTVTGNPFAFSGSPNADDGRLNWNNGDLIGATAKATHDLTMRYENYRIFVRATGFYDAVLDDRGAGARSDFTDKALQQVGRDYKLLDAFVSADYHIAEMPVNLRVGKQVINWGESTFILNGLNVFNPIDVTAFRRPGSEIKEALVPVNAIFGSISLPFDASLSGYYALSWKQFLLDPPGSPFSNSDVVRFGSGFGGNVNGVSFLSGRRTAGYRLNCLGLNPNDQVPTGLGAAIVQGILPNPTALSKVNCTQFGGPVNGLIDYNSKFPLGFYEQNSLAVASGLSSLGLDGNALQGIVGRDLDRAPNKSGDFGISAKYLAEWAGGTEFGFYYQNYASRLPFASERTGTPELGLATTSNSAASTGLAGRFATPVGCALPTSLGGQFGQTITAAGVGLNFVPIRDPQNLLNTTAVVNAALVLGAGAVTATNPSGTQYINTQTGHNLFFDSTHDALLNPVAQFSPTAVVHSTGGGQFVGGSFHTMGAAVTTNCALSILESGVTTLLGPPPSPTLFNGSMLLNSYNSLSLFLEYPENIDVWGFSFNTTIGGWGLQGEMTFRPDAPFQADTDQLTIAAVTQECAFGAGGNLTLLGFQALETTGAKCNPNQVGNADIHGILHNEMYTAQIGTTATFTGSDWNVDLVGADLGILVTEIGAVYVPGVEDTWVDKHPLVQTPGLPAGFNTYIGPAQYQNTGCQGSDLPLGGLLGLDHKTSKQCRPTNFSSGLVVLYRLDYNNAFDTGFTISPQIVYTYDFAGTTPAPYGNYLKDRQAISLGITGTLNNNFTIGASYVNFFGGHIENKSKDQDFASITASYSF
jgi:Protein of unknown function (DUF1302)